MIDTIFSLLGLTLADLNISDDVLFTVSSLFLLFCLGYVFNMFQTLLERCTAKRSGPS